MNNVLPARAGELVRAHLGGKVTGEPRTLVLATVASERLADGLTISMMFALIIFFFGQGHLDPQYAANLMYVAYLFAGIAIGVLAVLMVRSHLFSWADKLTTLLNHKASTYTLSRLQIFVNGLSPLCNPRCAIKIALWSIIIWSVELGVFASVTQAFGVALPLSTTVLFLVAVNFSSLIPAAPGGFGVIELVAKKILLSAGVQSDELALSMVLAQHVIQFAVIGLQGGFFLATVRSQLRDMETETNDDVVQDAVPPRACPPCHSERM